MRAVISDPERCAASITTTPRAAPEISRLRRGKSWARAHMAERHFGNRSPMFEQRHQQILMLGRIDFVMTAGQHRDGAGQNAGAMRGLIDGRAPAPRR